MAALPDDILLANGVPVGTNVPAGPSAPNFYPPVVPLNAEWGPGTALAGLGLTEGEKTAAAGGSLGLLWLIGLYLAWKDRKQIIRTFKDFL